MGQRGRRRDREGEGGTEREREGGRGSERKRERERKYQLTVLTPSMSSPLAAKSVASKKSTLSSLNSFSASILCNT